jgi:hypothetical protein
MSTPPRAIGIAAVMLCVAHAGPAAPAPPDAVEAAGRCEAAVAETVKQTRGTQAQEVQFIGAKRALSAMPDDETGVKGEGRYRRPGGGFVAFTYSCTVGVASGATKGVIFREIGGAASDSGKPWQPDLSRFTPEACESAAAQALKDKFPRVDRIEFANVRRLEPAPDALTSLEGQGNLQRAPGMNPSPFKYHCEFDARSGKVLRVQTSE